MPAMNMNAQVIHSTQALPNPSALFACVEKPPVAIVANAWQTASKMFMPANHKRRASTAVMPA